MQEQLQAVRERIGTNVKQLRQSRNWSQQELAELVGNTDKHIGQIERGEVNVTIDILTAVATHLSVDVVRLLQDPAAPPESYTIPGEVLDEAERALQALVKAKARQADT
jgi:transcriptional regulator with XRE-family HTH domain